MRLQFIYFDAAVSEINGTDDAVYQNQGDHNLIREMGALRIPVGPYQRSTSGETGSMVLNQSLRDPQFDFKTEFIPVSLEGREDLRQAQASVPWVWSWKDGHICRSH